MTDRSHHRVAQDRRVGVKRPPEGGGLALPGKAGLNIINWVEP